MADVYDVVITVMEQKGHCARGHKAGDKFYVRDGLTPGGLCFSAFAALQPAIRALMLGGEHPWEADKDATTLVCQDAANPVLFEVRRIRG
ncbi:MAG: TIGR04076 family protein [Bacillota bacterium]